MSEYSCTDPTAPDPDIGLSRATGLIELGIRLAQQLGI
jgi:hypothetical protein